MSVSKFKVGDVVQISPGTGCSFSGEEATVVAVKLASYELDLPEGHRDHSGWNDNNLTLISREDEDDMSDITTELKNLKLSADDRLLIDQGITDQSGNLTSTGQSALWQYVFQTHKDELVADLKTIVKAKKV